MNLDPFHLYSEYVFTSFKKTEKYLGDQHLDELFKQVLTYYNLNNINFLKAEIEKQLAKIEESDTRVRVNVFAKKRESFFKEKFSQEDLSFSIITSALNLPRNNLKLKTFLGLRDPSISKVKISNYVGSLFHKREALNLGLDDVLYKTTENEILETSTSNIFFKIKNEWVTPSLYIYKGLSRNQILLSAQALERRVFFKELCDCSDAFLVNSIEGVVFVDKIDDYIIENKDLKKELILFERILSLCQKNLK